MAFELKCRAGEVVGGKGGEDLARFFGTSPLSLLPHTVLYCSAWDGQMVAELLFELREVLPLRRPL